MAKRKNSRIIGLIVGLIIGFVLLGLLSPLYSHLAHSEDVETKVEALLSKMTLDEKIDYIGGYNSFHIRAIERLGIPEIKMADGPVGIRNFGPSISYPATIALAATWNQDLAEKFGQALGTDTKSKGAQILLAPGMNIYRLPICGRNFEYLGEDPYLTSRMAVGIIRGIQSQGVIACAKHFACNNQEWNRYQVSSEVGERALHEIYLPSFEACIKEAQVGAIMNSYNLLNGVYAPHNGMLNLEIAKGRWQHRGFIMSDWTSVYDGIEACKNGLDIEMPFAKYMNRATLLPAIEKGSITEAMIDDKVRRILRVLASFDLLEPKKNSLAGLYNKEGKETAYEVAKESLVLLKNTGILPLDERKFESIAVIGPRGLEPIAQGGGSSKVSPLSLQSICDALLEAFPSKKIWYARGTPDLTSFSSWGTFSPSKESQEKGLKGEYFENDSFEGSPILVRLDPKISFRWQENSFIPNGPVNHYSVRWTGYFTPPSNGKTTFYISGANAYRVVVDGKEILNSKNSQESLQWKTLDLQSGKPYSLCIEYKVGYGPQGIEFAVKGGEETSLYDALEVAKKADLVIATAGFDSSSEGEFWDRTFRLPENQHTLLEAVTTNHPNTLVLLFAGGNVDMNGWIDNTKGLLFCWYPGQEGAKAMADILTGKSSPCGKLPCSFEKVLSDNPCFLHYYDTDKNKKVCYKEDLFVGYRYYDQAKTKPRFCFGFGLSYSTFSYSNLKLTKRAPEKVDVAFSITNTGLYPAKEIAQVYVRQKQKKVPRPEKELKGFCKVSLLPGETKECVISLDERSFSYYDQALHDWTYDEGYFSILVGPSSHILPLKKDLYVERKK